ncbi:hypothetical protein [Gluconacetobacter sp.]
MKEIHRRAVGVTKDIDEQRLDRCRVMSDPTMAARLRTPAFHPVQRPA